MIKILSPTYWLYKKCKLTYCNEACLEKCVNKRKHNKLLSENIKLMFLIITLNSLFILNSNYIIHNLNQYNVFEQFINIVVSLIVLYLSYKCTLKINPDQLKITESNTNRCLKIYFAVVKKPMIFCVLVLLIEVFSIFIYYKANYLIKLAIIFIAIYYFGISRVVHFYMVFVTDTFQKIGKKTKSTTPNGQASAQRDISDIIKRKVYIVLMSYLSLILEYAIVYYVLANRFNMFSKGFKGIIESIYYSLVTITTIGYGDFYPTCNLSQIVVMSEIISGMFLLVVTLVTYMGEE